MTIEKQTDAASEQQEQTTNESQATEATQEPQVTEAAAEDVTNVGTVNKETETISVDLWGTSINLPVDKAKEVIEKRQSQSKGYNELKAKLEAYEVEKQTLQTKLQAAELAKEGKLEEAEAVFNQRLNEKVTKYHQKIVTNELKSELLSNPEFLGGEALTNDAISLITSKHKFELTDDNEIVSDGKSTKQLVSDFLKEREAYRKVAKGNSTSARPAAIVQTKGELSIARGLAEFLGQ